MKLTHGDVIIAAITSCTNTSNPSVMVAAGLLAKKAVERGMRSPALRENLPRPRQPRRHRLPQQGRPHPVSRSARFQHRRLRLHHLHRQQRPAARSRSPRPSKARDLVVAAVLSGNRNFEGRINPHVKANYLASPPLVVAFALAGTIDVESDGRADRPRTTKASQSSSASSGPRRPKCNDTIAHCLSPEMFRNQYANVAIGQRRVEQDPRQRRRALSIATKRAPTSRSRRSSPI